MSSLPWDYRHNRTLRVAAQFQLAELHVERVEEQQPMMSELPLPGRASNLGGLDATDIPGNTPRPPPSAQLGTMPGGGGRDTSSGSRAHPDAARTTLAWPRTEYRAIHVGF
jgi:hypothetical protein